MIYKKVRVFSSSVQNCRIQNTEYNVGRRNMYAKEEKRKRSVSKFLNRELMDNRTYLLLGPRKVEQEE